MYLNAEDYGNNTNTPFVFGSSVSPYLFLLPVKNACIAEIQLHKVHGEGTKVHGEN